jgi:sugar lactone lactonase YvrE
MIHSCCSIQTTGTPLPYPASEAKPDLVIGSEGTGPGQFLFATDVAVAPNGDIFVGDRKRLDIQRFDSGGTYLETIGKPANGGLLTPGIFSRIVGIAVDGDGRLYVAEDDQQQIVRLESDGTWSAVQLPRRDNRINGLAVDRHGNIFVSQIDYIAGSFWVFAPDGTLIAQVGTLGNGLGQFDGPSGIALDGQGNAYVADWAIGSIQKFQLDYEQIDAAAEDTGG